MKIRAASDAEETTAGVSAAVDGNFSRRSAELQSRADPSWKIL